jgi:hypothetical protein
LGQRLELNELIAVKPQRAGRHQSLSSATQCLRINQVRDSLERGIHAASASKSRNASDIPKSVLLPTMKRPVKVVLL